MPLKVGGDFTYAGAYKSPKVSKISVLPNNTNHGVLEGTQLNNNLSENYDTELSFFLNSL